MDLVDGVSLAETTDDATGISLNQCRLEISIKKFRFKTKNNIKKFRWGSY